MRKSLTVILFIAATVCLATGGPEVDVSGSWSGQVTGQDGGSGRIHLVLKQEGSQISGTAGPSDKQISPQIYDVKLQGNRLTFAADDADEGGTKLIYRFDLTVTGNRIDGKANGSSRDRSWTLDVSVTRDK